MQGEVGAQAIPVFHQGVRPKIQPGFLPAGFPIQHAVGIGRALVRVVAPHFPAKIDRGIAGVFVLGRRDPSLVGPVFADKALQTRPRFLAFHPLEEIRCLAYRTILLFAPQPEAIPNLPMFMESGLSFLNEESIREIASSKIGKHRLDALKQRLYYYRTHFLACAFENATAVGGCAQDALQFCFAAP